MYQNKFNAKTIKTSIIWTMLSILSTQSIFQTTIFAEADVPEKEVLSADPTVLVPYNFTVDNATYTITEMVIDGEINAIEANVNERTLDIDLTSYKNGSLTLELPRTVIDSRQAETDIPFTVLIDGKETRSIETQVNPGSRTLVINFTHPTNNVEIIGTQIVPEFESSVTLLFFSILALIAILQIGTARNLGFLNKVFHF